MKGVLPYSFGRWHALSAKECFVRFRNENIFYMETSGQKRRVVPRSNSSQSEFFSGWFFYATRMEENFT